VKGYRKIGFAIFESPSQSALGIARAAGPILRWALSRL